MNFIALILLLVVLSYIAWLATRLRRRTFTTVAIQLIKARSRMQQSRLSLDEFLHTCYILGINRCHIYQEMHLAVVRPMLKDHRRRVVKNRDDRQTEIFRSFAANSQFTQGFEGFRMHRLLHQFQHTAYGPSDDAPEMMTFYQVSEMCATMRNLPEPAPKSSIEPALKSHAEPAVPNESKKAMSPVAESKKATSLTAAPATANESKATSPATAIESKKTTSPAAATVTGKESKKAVLATTKVSKVAPKSLQVPKK